MIDNNINNNPKNTHKLGQNFFQKNNKKTTKKYVINMINKLLKMLKKCNKFVDTQGNIIKSEIISSSNKIDEDLIKILIEDNEVKETFFKKKEYFIFNSNKFNEYILGKNE